MRSNFSYLYFYVFERKQFKFLNILVITSYINCNLSLWYDSVYNQYDGKDPTYFYSLTEMSNMKFMHNII